MGNPFNDPESRRRAASLAGLSSSARLTPDQRVERARIAGLASAAKRKAAREAAGLPEPRPNNRLRPMPSPDELEPYREAIRAERAANGEPPLSYDAEVREAALRVRRDVARAALDALKSDR